MYGSSLSMETEIPRATSKRPMLAAVMPFPREEVTPPVTKTYFTMAFMIGELRPQGKSHLAHLVICATNRISRRWLLLWVFPHCPLAEKGGGESSPGGGVEKAQ